MRSSKGSGGRSVDLPVKITRTKATRDAAAHATHKILEAVDAVAGISPSTPSPKYGHIGASGLRLFKERSARALVFEARRMAKIAGYRDLQRIVASYFFEYCRRRTLIAKYFERLTEPNIQPNNEWSPKGQYEFYMAHCHWARHEPCNQFCAKPPGPDAPNDPPASPSPTSTGASPVVDGGAPNGATETTGDDEGVDDEEDEAALMRLLAESTRLASKEEPRP